uniref:Uncharacterized protein n=1 Tax=Leptobrachium leishanense TaxID=445787 RepID=A0A8C5QQY0_9ANUR
AMMGGTYLQHSGNLTFFLISIHSSENTDRDTDMDLVMDICDLIDSLKHVSVVEVKNPLYYQDAEGTDMSGYRSLKQIKETLLASFHLLVQQRRKAQVGYNINSFGLRFGKRETHVNWKPSTVGFSNNQQPFISVRTLQEDLCSE